MTHFAERDARCRKCAHAAHPDAVCTDASVMDACGCTDWRVFPPGKGSA